MPSEASGSPPTGATELRNSGSGDNLDQLRQQMRQAQDRATVAEQALSGASQMLDDATRLKGQYQRDLEQQRKRKDELEAVLVREGSGTWDASASREELDAAMERRGSSRTWGLGPASPGSHQDLLSELSFMSDIPCVSEAGDAALEPPADPEALPALKAQAQQLRTQNARWMTQYARAVARLATKEARMRELAKSLEQTSGEAAKQQADVAVLERDLANMKQELLSAQGQLTELRVQTTHTSEALAVLQKSARGSGSGPPYGLSSLGSVQASSPRDALPPAARPRPSLLACAKCGAMHVQSSPHNCALPVKRVEDRLCCFCFFD